MKPKYRVVRDERVIVCLPIWTYNDGTIRGGPWGVLDRQDNFINPSPFSDKRDAMHFAAARRRHER
jgi:hypothetical protein